MRVCFVCVLVYVGHKFRSGWSDRERERDTQKEKGRKRERHAERESEEERERHAERER